MSEREQTATRYLQSMAALRIHTVWDTNGPYAVMGTVPDGMVAVSLLGSHTDVRCQTCGGWLVWHVNEIHCAKCSTTKSGEKMREWAELTSKYTKLPVLIPKNADIALTPTENASSATIVYVAGKVIVVTETLEEVQLKLGIARNVFGRLISAS